MKKCIALALVAIMVLGALVGCGSATTSSTSVDAAKTSEVEQSETTEGNAGEELNFVWVNPQLGIEYWSAADEGAKAAAKDFGVNIDIVGSVQVSAETQVSYIDTAISQQVDGIITCPWDETAFADVIKRAAEAGIPFVAVDTDCPVDGRSVFYGTSNYEAGQLAGEQMIELTGGKANICVMASVLTSPNQQERIQGFTDAIADYPDMQILTEEQSDSELTVAVDKAGACYLAYPECDAFFGASAVDGLGAAKAAEEQGRDITVVGFDDTEENIQYVKEEKIHALLVQDPYMMVYSGVEALIKINNGEKIDEVVNSVPVKVVTAGNVNELY